ncbi:hypothetical protein LOC71_14200 [Rhodopirellula sp. JC740]|uniref:Uncharacterized protein n=1 Tax=Rhodopirellula halodulae TaxID=2894198 RepID=A0ABS8NIQ2_9BACT|nr:hypothetical protein [Rhodopirellula sp. JC740]MCC9643433.1 hypothetical protein [Rhodopirellula sp. JC740]
MSDSNPPSEQPIDFPVGDATPDESVPPSDREPAAGDALTRPGLPTAESDGLEGEDSGGDSIFDQIIQCHPNPQLANDLLDELQFAMLGLRTFESRLHIIRNATKRSAGALASVQVTKPSTVNECHLARVITSAYRVMDPRYRIDRHQQVQLGRILPFELEFVAHTEFSQLTEFAATPSTQTSRSKPNNELVPGPPPTVPDDSNTESDQAKSGKRLVDAAVDASVAPPPSDKTDTNWIQPAHERSLMEDLPPRNENELVLEEMRLNRGRVRRWMMEVRTLIGLSVLCLAATFYLAYWLGGRQAAPPVATAEDASQEQETNVPATPPTGDSGELKTPSGIETSGSSKASPTEASDKPPVSLSPPVDQLALENLTDDAPNAAQSDISQPDLNPMENTLDEAHAMQPNSRELNADSAEPDTDMSPPEVAGPAVVEMVENAADDNAAEDVEDKLAETMPVSSANANDSDDSPRQNPAPAIGKKPFTIVEIEEATQQLWNETDRVTRRFQRGESEGLIDQWELISELAGPGSLEHLAAMNLCLRASWLTEPLDRIQARAESLADQTAVATGNPPPNESASTSTESPAWSDPTLRKMVESWSDCRATVSSSENLNHLLMRANELLDELILDNRNQWCSTLGLLAEKLSPFTTDEASQTELEDLLSSIKTLPDEDELQRMKQSAASAGVYGRTLCLQLRRWEEGLPLMCEASDSRLASLARAEMQWRDDVGAERDQPTRDRGELGIRWSKIAPRYNGRDAAAIRLHAFELLRGVEDFAAERKAILDLLPQYMQLDLAEAEATQSLSAPLRLSRLR